MGTNLVNPLAAIVAQARQTLPAQTGAAQAAQVRRAERRMTICADVSGSMQEMAHGGRRKIEILREALVQVASPETVCIAFSTATHRCSPSELPEPNGRTAMHLAISDAVAVDPLGLLMISDGEPDDPGAALRAAGRLRCRINTLYIGPESNQRAIDFMRQLASAGVSKGRADVHDLSRVQPMALARTVASLLDGPR